MKYFTLQSVRPDWAIIENSLFQFFLKVAQIYGDFSGFLKHHFSSKNSFGYFCGHFSEILGYFLFQHLSGHTAWLAVTFTASNLTFQFDQLFAEQSRFIRAGKVVEGPAFNGTVVKIVKELEYHVSQNFVQRVRAKF